MAHADNVSNLHSKESVSAVFTRKVVGKLTPNLGVAIEDEAEDSGVPSRSFSHVRVPDKNNLDAWQQEAVARALKGEDLLITGVPGSGRTSVAAHIVAGLAKESENNRWATLGVTLGGDDDVNLCGMTAVYDPEDEMDTRPALLLVPSGEAAKRLRTKISQINRGLSSAVVIGTPVGIAQQILNKYSFWKAAFLGEKLPVPVLLSGPEHDFRLACILEKLKNSDVKFVSELYRRVSLESPRFRGEIRDILTRVTEIGLDSKALLQLAHKANLSVWEDSASVLSEYEKWLQENDYQALDHASMIARAIEVLPIFKQEFTAFIAGSSGSKFASMQLQEKDKNHLAGGYWKEIPFVRSIVVDDYQDMTFGAARLIAALREIEQEYLDFKYENSTGVTMVTETSGSPVGAPGSSRKISTPNLVILGNPDIATQTFRGAMAEIVGEARGQVKIQKTPAKATKDASLPLSQKTKNAQIATSVADDVCINLGGFGLTSSQQIVLKQRHRGKYAQGKFYDDFVKVLPVAKMAGVRIPSFERDLRNLKEDEQEEQIPSVMVKLAASRSSEHRLVADYLRSQRLLENRSWSEMAVLLRSDKAAEEMRFALANHCIPVKGRATVPLLRECEAVKPLLWAAEILLGRQESLKNLPKILTSYLAEVTQKDIAMLGKERYSLEEVVFANGDDQDFSQLRPLLLGEETNTVIWEEIPQRLKRPFEKIRKVLYAAWQEINVHDNAQRVIWKLWQGAAVSEKWASLSLSEHSLSAYFDQCLDDVVAFFKSAQVQSERDNITLAGFVDYHLLQAFQTDSIAQVGQRDNCVEVMTVAQAMGKSWPVVVISGVEDGAWPNPRVRDAFLLTNHLEEVALGRAKLGEETSYHEKSMLVIKNEMRLFAAAISRCDENLLLTAVANENVQPSVLIARLQEYEDSEKISSTRFIGLGEASTIAKLRAVAEKGVKEDNKMWQEVAAQALGALACEGYRSAHPNNWKGLEIALGANSHRSQGEIRISASKIDRLLECPLREALDEATPFATGNIRAQMGALIHQVFEEYADSKLKYDQLLPAMQSRGEALYEAEDWGEASVHDLKYIRDAIEIACRHIANYLASVNQNNDVEVKAEVKTELDVSQFGNGVKVKLVGKADRIEIYPNKLRIIDLKTGKTPPDSKKLATHGQLGAYRFLVLKGAYPGVKQPGEVEAALLFPRKSEKLEKMVISQRVTSEENQTENLKWFEEKISQAIEFDSEFPIRAKANSNCKYCDYQHMCPVLSASKGEA